VIAEVLDAAGVPRAESEGLEADDAIATLVARHQGSPVVIVTGDRDLLSLVRDPDVKVLFPLKGLKEVTEFTEEDVAAKYGVPPRLYAEFATLRGDPSDGLPGVQGIGPKRASTLLAQHGSIDAILGKLDTLPPKQAQAFENARDYLVAMKTVVGLLDDADVWVTEGHPPDEPLMAELGQVHNLGSSATRLVQALKGER
jgi:5'-3' exonuclease